MLDFQNKTNRLLNRLELQIDWVANAPLLECLIFTCSVTKDTQKITERKSNLPSWSFFLNSTGTTKKIKKQHKKSTPKKLSKKQSHTQFTVSAFWFNFKDTQEIKDRSYS